MNADYRLSRSKDYYNIGFIGIVKLYHYENQDLMLSCHKHWSHFCYFAAIRLCKRYMLESLTLTVWTQLPSISSTTMPTLVRAVSGKCLCEKKKRRKYCWISLTESLHQAAGLVQPHELNTRQRHIHQEFYNSNNTRTYQQPHVADVATQVTHEAWCRVCCLFQWWRIPCTLYLIMCFKVNSCSPYGVISTLHVVIVQVGRQSSCSFLCRIVHPGYMMIDPKDQFDCIQVDHHRDNLHHGNHIGT